MLESNRVRDWELHVHFKVHGKGRDLFGDGFAIWYARDRLRLGRCEKRISHFMYFKLVASLTRASLICLLI